MTKKIKFVSSVCIVAAAFCVAYYLWHRFESGVTQPSRIIAENDAAQSKRNDQIALARGQSVASPIAVAVSTRTVASYGAQANNAAKEMPPVDAPLSSSLETLQRLASQGYSPAKCRLAVELHRCGTLAYLQTSVDGDTARALAVDPNTKGRAGALEEARVREDELSSTERACKGVPRALANEGWRSMLEAAQAGHTPSALRFAFAPPLDDGNFTPQLEGWAQYKEQALPLLTRAADAGDANALYMLGWVYAGFPMPGSTVLTAKNDALAFAYLTAARTVATPESYARLDRMLARVMRNLKPDALSQARTMAQQLESKVAALAPVAMLDQPFPQTPSDCARE